MFWSFNEISFLIKSYVSDDSPLKQIEILRSYADGLSKIGWSSFR